jgi:hypothetical protein
MTHYCLDACSIINLFCGWGGIQELHGFGSSWSTTATALDEFKEARSEQPDGVIVRMSLDRATLLLQYPLRVHSELTAEELTTSVALAEDVDDGEAEVLAVAYHRSLVFVSDDRIAVTVAERLGVPSVSSLDLISQWAGLDRARPGMLPEILRRIEVLARYVPPQTHAKKPWWDRYRR